MIQKREIGISILLTIVTCGIYGIFWFISLTDDIKRASGDESLPSGGIAFLLTLVTCGIYGFYWAYRMGKALQTIQTNADMAAAADNSVLFIILQVFGLAIVNYAIMQSTLNSAAAAGANGAPVNNAGAIPQQPTQPENNNQDNGTPAAQ